MRASAQVVVVNTGWHGTLSLTADPATVTTTSPDTTLVARTEPPIASPYILTLYDDGRRVGSCTGSTYSDATGCRWDRRPATNSTHVYTAYVALDFPDTGPPDDDVRASAQAVVVHTGWHGTVRLAADPPTVTPQDPDTTLVARMDPPIANPYILTLYDDGRRVDSCLAGGYWSIGECRWSRRLAAGSSHVYSVYVAQDYPDTGVPSRDVRAWASLGLGNADGQPPGHLVVEGIDVDSLAEIIGAATADEVEAALLGITGTHLQGTSTSDQYNAYTAARASGATVKDALLAAVGVGAGGAFLWKLWVDLHPAPAPPEAPTSPEPPAPDPTPSGPHDPVNAEDALIADLRDRSTATGPELAQSTARIFARQCLHRTGLAIQAGALPATIGGRHPCRSLPIYLPGSSAPQTTQHNADAIARHPAWVALNYVKGSEREAPPAVLKRSWYLTEPACQAPEDEAPGKQCDEYPFYASAQSGPGASLRRLDGTDNRTAGGTYRAFIGKCRLSSGGTGASPEAPAGSLFLVIPMAWPQAPPTTKVCLP